jgi:catechol 2,3-dioxygenase-like lactoylglutathione lyase family enzyme
MEPRISIITFGVADIERSYQFYKDGLGFPTSGNPSDGIVFFKTAGARFAIYPKDKLAEEFDGKFASETGAFRSFTVAHNTRCKEEVEAVLKLAEQAGDKIEKPAQDVFWGGYSGYFSDPDGYLWEVAYADCWKFNDDGSLVLD